MVDDGPSHHGPAEVILVDSAHLQGALLREQFLNLRGRYIELCVRDIGVEPHDLQLPSLRARQGRQLSQLLASRRRVVPGPELFLEGFRTLSRLH